MYAHPRDTREASRPIEKQSHNNAKYSDHMWYAVHYDQMTFEKGKYEAKKVIAPVKPTEGLKQLVKQAMVQRFNALLDVADEQHVRVLEGKPTSALVHGLGGGHVCETSLTVHPVYGVPYIPASSIKGVVRRWYIEAFLDGREKNLLEGDGESAQLGRIVFGSQERKGAVQFTDLFFHEQLELKPDVLTPHFPDYYNRKKSATDDQDPNPITFYAVNASSAEWYFMIPKATVASIDGQAIASEALADLVVSWTARALTELGIGSKTASGYGRFSSVIDVTEERLAGQLKKREEERRLRKERLAEERRAREAARKAEEERQRLAKMSPRERLLYDIGQLGEGPEDIEKSKGELYTRIVEANDVDVATALREYWRTTGQWKVKNKKSKQFAKVQDIKKILGE
ncbi:type III-B CRISPR module RAMP protein Cmr6 [Numidum massiliense]|uniref:type III-B CRISPR module RAMP protein Cmr6 n=1 Tax=Numidum massiliense TaxID=1522315 RepID=UPI0006D570F5|nr:type III-B CRISPR module RAMP protein Cmr6 [Numidum massiliense]